MRERVALFDQDVRLVVVVGFCAFRALVIVARKLHLLDLRVQAVRISARSSKTNKNEHKIPPPPPVYSLKIHQFLQLPNIQNVSHTRFLLICILRK